MKKNKITTNNFLFITLLITFLIQGCSEAPEEFKKGKEMYFVQKFDSALFYFSTIKPDAGKWIDSAKSMQKNCFSGMIENNKYDMFNESFNLYKNDSAISLDAINNLSKSIYTILISSKKKEAYLIIDKYKGVLPDAALNKAIEEFLNYILLGSQWEIKSSQHIIKGNYIYFSRDTLKNIIPLKTTLNGKSSSNNSGWTKGKIIYKNIVYTKNGKFGANPLIFRGSQSYYGKRGSLEVISYDSLVINYGQQITGGSKINLVRSAKKK